MVHGNSGRVRKTTKLIQLEEIDNLVETDLDLCIEAVPLITHQRSEYIIRRITATHPEDAILYSHAPPFTTSKHLPTLHYSDAPSAY